MSETEMRELDAWVAENVMGWRTHCRNTAFYVNAGTENGIMEKAVYVKSQWKPTTDPAACSLVRKACLKRLDEKFGNYAVEICFILGRYWATYEEYRADADTEELCWSLFARALFGKDGE